MKRCPRCGGRITKKHVVVKQLDAVYGDRSLVGYCPKTKEGLRADELFKRGDYRYEE